ncbi:ABC transporter permease [Methanohalobium evestigatum]|nr:ABC transporter permease [Methanohalobium evestigatum]
MNSESGDNKGIGLRNILFVAQKEFADNVTNSMFLLLTATYLLIIFTFSYRSVILDTSLKYGLYEDFILLSVFGGLIEQVGWFIPLIGIALGFNTVIKERKSGSLNVLLTHPVFRDNIIAGKLLGITGVIAFVIMSTVVISSGTLIAMLGIQVSLMEITRIALFSVFTLFYALIYAGIAVLISTVVYEATNSLIYNVAIWILTCIFTGSIMETLSDLLTKAGIDLKASELIMISPLHYYSKITQGTADMSFLGVGVQYEIDGILDAQFTLAQWFNTFWTDITAILIIPIILLFASFIMFMRQDITL